MGVKPISGETELRMHAAAQWLARAHDATGDGGVSHGYFPCNSGSPWHASYPETTGYIISTLLRYAAKSAHSDFHRRALCMAEWEIALQMPSGAVQGGTVSPAGRQTPCAFNTGMVVDGWCTAYEHTSNPAFLAAAGRAVKWLIADIGPQGFFRTNGEFVSQDEIKNYNVLCAWSMYRYGQLRSDPSACAAAVRVVEAGLTNQLSNGWFRWNCLTEPLAPLLHTLAYTLQGIVEVGALAGREDFIAAAVRGLDPILANMSSAGFLPARFKADWKPVGRSSCLTGSAQTAIVGYRLAQLTGKASYRAKADRIVNYLKALQALDTADPGINGALAGSFPIFAPYMRGGYPNWATKYFLDSLMLQSDTGP